MTATPQTEKQPAIPEESLERIAERIDKALQAIDAFEDHEAQMHALGLKTALEDFHKTALTKIVQKLKADERGKELLFELVDEPSVLAVLQLHGLVKPNVAARVVQVLEYVRPYMQSHGGDVELASVEGETAFVRLSGACNGCSQSAVTLREGVEEAILQNIPQIKRVEVVPNEPGPSLIQIESLKTGRSKGWIETLSTDDVPEGRMKCFRADAANILIVNIENRLSAFRNECPHQGLPLDGGLLEPEARTLSCPWHGFKFDASSGECLTAPQAQLESYPLRVENGKIWVRCEG